MLPRDVTRCQDGPGQCPRADECARTEYPADGRVWVSTFFAGTVGQPVVAQGCEHFIARSGEAGS